MGSCIFCKIIKGTEKSWIIHKDDKVTAFLDAYPVTEGHVLVAFNKHVDNLFKLSDEEFLHMMRIARKISLKMKNKLGAQFVNIITAESVINHAFIHVIPRSDYDLMGIVPDMENKRTMSNDVMETLYKKLCGGKIAKRKI